VGEGDGVLQFGGAAGKVMSKIATEVGAFTRPDRLRVWWYCSALQRSHVKGLPEVQFIGTGRLRV
jgi:hypothetical protein